MCVSLISEFSKKKKKIPVASNLFFSVSVLSICLGVWVLYLNLISNNNVIYVYKVCRTEERVYFTFRTWVELCIGCRARLRVDIFLLYWCHRSLFVCVCNIFANTLLICCYPVCWYASMLMHVYLLNLDSSECVLWSFGILWGWHCACVSFFFCDFKGQFWHKSSAMFLI